jgi:cellobiose-specific phosphotransferase system component IIC
MILMHQLDGVMHLIWENVFDMMEQIAFCFDSFTAKAASVLVDILCDPQKGNNSILFPILSFFFFFFFFGVHGTGA